jgi:TfoX/Sxy family transcriptional regulator of competence genes
MPYSKEIEDRIDALITPWPNIEKKKMFGGICYLINGNICFGIWKEYLIVRTSVETAEEKLQERQVKPFDNRQAHEGLVHGGRGEMGDTGGAGRLAYNRQRLRPFLTGKMK